MKIKKSISNKRLKRLRIQGYCNITDENLSELSFGNRFAYILCVLIILIGVGTINIPILSGIFVISFLGIILPNHPFDYIYNYLLADLLKKPRLPRRSKQIRFACTIASILLIMILYSFINNYLFAGYIISVVLLSSATLASVTDICVPSIVYNFIIGYKV